MASAGVTEGNAKNYDDRGSGAPVVLLHPFPFARDVWAGFADVLAVRYRVISVDARGFGASAPHGSFAIADLADDLAGLLSGLAIERATVLGMSMGGYAALAFANRHPDLLAGLILANTRATADSPETRAGRATALATIRDAGPEAYLVSSLPRLLSPAAPAALATHARARAESRARSLSAGVEALRDRPDRSGELAAIRCPTLVIAGQNDQVTPAAEMRGMAAAIPGATFVELPEAGHISHLEAPGPFESAVSTFLASTLGSTGGGRP